MIYRKLIRPLAFGLTRADPERAHEWTVGLLHRVGGVPVLATALRSLFALEDPRLERRVCGIRFPNPVGLAGGFDKDATAVAALAALGFGFVEVGTATLRPQPGNPRPRMFRLPASRALINRMGFNNRGVEALAQRLEACRPLPIPVGVSLGKNKGTSEADSVEEYCRALRVVYPHLDYFALNVSSPNTPGLRQLQGRELLDVLLGRLLETAAELAAGATTKPLFVKIAPDLSHAHLRDLLDVCLARGVAGIIAVNTTIQRDGVKGVERALADEAGGLSGRPLGARAREVVSFIHREAGGELPVIGVGGIMSPDDALRMFDAGASLIQLYTGLVYEGIGLVKAINRALLRA
jgi:dihydroorotate dehydrogenase